jgi:hypothetical protein
MLATVFQRPQFRPGGADIHRVKHPQVPVVEPAAAQRHGVQLQPAGALLGPLAPDRNALAQQAAGARAAPPA